MAKTKKTRRPRNHDYLVRWEIDVTATSPKEAAKAALDIQRNSDGNLAQLFDVTDSKGVTTRVDLWEGL
jgi:hypothetical protein